LAVELADATPVTLAVEVLPPAARPGSLGVKATVTLTGPGAQVVSLPWSAFARPLARGVFRNDVGSLRLTTTGQGRPLALRAVEVVAGETVAVRAPRQGASAPAGGEVVYAIEVGNPGTTPATFRLDCERNGWEAMTVAIEPAQVTLAPGTWQTCQVRVAIPSRLPPGGSERQTIRVTAAGAGATSQTTTFVTACALPHPTILHTAAGWADIRQRVATYPWAAAALRDQVAQATKWQVPEVLRAPGNDPGDTMGPALFVTANEKDLMACAISWQATRDRALAEKVAVFLRRLASPVDGYPTTLRACNQGFVQEGHFFQHIAMAYDLILDAGVLTPADRGLIEQTLRRYIALVERENRRGLINNWNLSEICGAFYAALAMQDLAAAERLFSGPCGIVDQLAKGTMDDGWWYECSISYNVWCASEFTQAALAYAPWGLDFRHLSFPASFSREVSLADPNGGVELNGGYTGLLDPTPRPFGMSRELWGPLTKPSRRITDLWDSLLPFIDDRGVMIGVNDSTERRVAGTAFELAYFAFRDPRYAALIPRTGKRDLLYGLPDLPPPDPQLGTRSATAGNVGLTMLRSQTAGRAPRDQIQASLHFGSHGWAHGHFDRTALLALTRHGRSFYNPEMVWYGYPSFMYKFFVQTSMTKNMVVVDRKMQEPTESRQLLFHSGTLLQAAVVETVSRWSDPPYGGMIYDYIPAKDFADKSWQEGRSVPIPENPPAYGTLGRFTEPVRQRRLLAVTDDYVVVADALAGEQDHTYDCLYQMKGFQGLTAANQSVLRHDPQMDPDPLGAAQFITNCTWYQVTAPARASFLMRFGPGADNEGTRTMENEDGPLAMDVHVAWPAQAEVMIGTQPEVFPVEKQVTWEVRGDGVRLAQGRVGTWVLGAAPIDVPLTGIASVDLVTSVSARKRSTLFWGQARLVLADGREVPLSAVPLTRRNVQLPASAGRDYAGGPITLVGSPDAAAIPTEPQDAAAPAVLSLDLRGLGAVRLRATLAGDFPLGDETQRRKTLAIRSTGRSARYLTVIEPGEGTRRVARVTADSADHVIVELIDGRRQELTIRGLAGSDEKPTIELVETSAGGSPRRETAGR
jgi:hypothetical protein